MADIQEMLRAKARGERNAVGEIWGDHICEDAASRIAALEAENERMREALRFYATKHPCCTERCTARHDECEYPSCHQPVFPTWDDGRTARAALGKQGA